MNFNQSVAIKAGLIGAAAGLVVALLGRIPFIGCIIAPLGWLVAVATGALYVYFAGRVPVAEGAGSGACRDPSEAAGPSGGDAPLAPGSGSGPTEPARDDAASQPATARNDVGAAWVRRHGGATPL